MLSAPALDRGVLSEQALQEANQITLNDGLCGLCLWRTIPRTLLGSPRSQARVCANAHAGADSKGWVSQPQHRQGSVLKEAAPSQRIPPSEKSKERARLAYARQQKLKAAKALPAQDSTAALTKAGTAQPADLPAGQGRQ